jgi:hypothetical protein
MESSMNEEKAVWGVHAGPEELKMLLRMSQWGGVNEN